MQSVLPGRTYCLRIAATDTVGHTADGDWGGCTSTAVDDRRMERTASWRRHASTAYYRGTYLESRAYGATLTLGRASEPAGFAVRALVGPGQGKIRIWLGGEWRDFDLSRPTRRVRDLWMGDFTCGRTVKIRVRSHGKPVRIDAATPVLPPEFGECGFNR